MIIVFDLLFLFSMSFTVSWIYDELEKEWKEWKRNAKKQIL